MCRLDRRSHPRGEQRHTCTINWDNCHPGFRMVVHGVTREAGKIKGESPLMSPACLRLSPNKESQTWEE